MDPWLVLGVDPGADAGAVRAAYHRLARQHHPDHGGSTTRMREINAAYALLRAVGCGGPFRSGPQPPPIDPRGPDHVPFSPPAGGCRARVVARDVTVWLAGTRSGQWLTSLVIFVVVHQLAVATSIGAPSLLEALTALLALSLQATATPAGRTFVPGRDALALAVLVLRAAFWCADQW